MAAITFNSSAPTLVGSVPVSFAGALQYTPVSSTQGTLTVQVQNTSDPSLRSYLLAFGFGNPGGAITAVQPTYVNFGMGQIGAPSYKNGYDCANATTGWGTHDIGYSVNGVDWNNAGYILTPRAGLRPSQIGAVQMNLVGTGMLALNESSFQTTLTSGGRFFPVQFGLLNDEQGSTGRSYIAAG